MPPGAAASSAADNFVGCVFRVFGFANCCLLHSTVTCWSRHLGNAAGMDLLAVSIHNMATASYIPKPRAF